MPSRPASFVDVEQILFVDLCKRDSIMFWRPVGFLHWETYNAQAQECPQMGCKQGVMNAQTHIGPRSVTSNVLELIDNGPALSGFMPSTLSCQPTQAPLARKRVSHIQLLLL